MAMVQRRGRVSSRSGQRAARPGKRRRSRPTRWRAAVLLVAVAGLLVPAVLWLNHDAPDRGLSAPRNTRVDETAANMLRVAWFPVARTSYYQVTITSTKDPDSPLTVRSSTPQVQLPALKAGVDYTLRVRAVVGSGTREKTPFSTPIKTRTAEAKKPALLIPQSFEVHATKPGSIGSSWEEIESATGYELQYSTRDDFAKAKVVATEEPQITVDELDGGIPLFVRVRATGPSKAVSEWSTVGEVSTGILETPPEPVRVASYNVRCHSCGGPSWGSRRGPVAALIDSQNPDVVGLQEAQQSRPKGVGTSQFADLVNAVSSIGPDYKITQSDPDASKGTKIMYKPATLTLMKQGAIRYSSQRGGATTRYAAWAIFKQRSTGKEFTFFSTHLEPKSYGVRIAQARQLAKSMKQIAGDRPVVAVGDFNASQFHFYGIHQAMTSAGLVDVIGVQASSRLPSKGAPVEKRIHSNYDSYQADKRTASATTSSPELNGVYLDYIFTSPMRVLEFENVMRIDSSSRFIGTRASDHNMLRADIVLPK